MATLVVAMPVFPQNMLAGANCPATAGVVESILGRNNGLPSLRFLLASKNTWDNSI